MLYWLYLLTFVLSVLVYTIHPRTDKMKIDNFQLAKSAVNEFVLQAEAARNLMLYDKSPSFMGTVSCLDSKCNEAAQKLADPDTEISEAAQYEALLNALCERHTETHSYRYKCRQRSATCLTKISDDITDYQQLLKSCPYGSYYARAMKGETPPTEVIEGGLFSKISVLSGGTLGAPPVGIIKESAIKNMAPPGFTGELIEDSSASPITDEKKFQSMVLCIDNATGKGAVRRGKPACQRPYLNTIDQGTSDFVITYGRVPNYWIEKPEYRDLWKRALSDMSKRNPECGFIKLTETTDNSAFVQYQNGTKYAVHTPFGDHIRIPCLFTKFLAKNLDDNSDAALAHPDTSKDKEPKYTYLICIHRIFETKNPNAPLKTAPNGRQIRPFQAISTSFCSK